MTLPFLVFATALLRTSFGWADVTTSRAHYEKARAYYQVGEYGQALEEFKAAHIEKRDPAFLYNIAECYRELGRSDQALIYYRRFLGLADPDDPIRPEAERHIVDLDSLERQRTQAPAPPSQSFPASQAQVQPVSPKSPAAPISLSPARPPAPAPSAPTAPTIAATDQSPTASPLYKRGWLWASVTVVVVGAIGGWWLASSRQGPDVPQTSLGHGEIFGP